MPRSEWNVNGMATSAEKWLTDAKGFGFITQDGGSADYSSTTQLSRLTDSTPSRQDKGWVNAGQGQGVYKVPMCARRIPQLDEGLPGVNQSATVTGPANLSGCAAIGALEQQADLVT
jgi:hypothetical protein